MGRGVDDDDVTVLDSLDGSLSLSLSLSLSRSLSRSLSLFLSVSLCFWSLFISISHVTHMNESCHTYICVLSLLQMSRVTRMNESCHTYE